MTHLKNTYGLKAIPSEKILKDLKPVRGMVITTTIDVPPGDRSVLIEMEAGSLHDPKLWKGGKVLVDALPIIERIAAEMGYDPKLLVGGEGETGVAGHSWTNYADDGECPLLVRWEAGDARLLLCVGLPMFTGRVVFQPTREAYLTILGDKAAGDIMKRVGLALEGLADGLKPCEAEVAVGNTLRKVKMEECGHYFEFQCRISVDARKGPNAVRRADYLELMHSAGLWLDDLSKPRDRHVFSLMNMMGVEEDIRPVDGMQVCQLHDNKLRFTYAPEQPLSAEVRDLIHRQSVKDTQAMMNWILSKSVLPAREEESPEGFPRIPSPEFDYELEERRMRHEALCDEADGKPGRQNYRRMHVLTFQQMFKEQLPTLGTEFRHLPGHVLRGTGPQVAMKGGDLSKTWDLLDFLFAQLAELPNLFPAKGSGRGGLTLKAKVVAPIVSEQYRDKSVVNHRIVPITNPFYGMHKGLPVRIDKSLTIWRECDTEALAADFFYAPETKDLHVANLYRVKVPKG
jgi:hypothetical protein